MIATIITNAIALWLGSELLRGVEIGGFIRALIIGAGLGVLNWLLGGLLSFITAPLHWLTFGLFAWVVDALIIMVAAYFFKGLKIENFWWAVALAVFVSFTSTIIRVIF